MNIFVLLSLFAKTPGDTRSISMCPSNFGLEQMQKEDAYGPSGTQKNHADIANKEDDIDLVKLKAYEASKLRYYFAVAEFTDSKVLDYVHDEFNNQEIKHSSIAIELRLILVLEKLKEITTNRQVKEKATFPIPSNYNPPDFMLDVLQYAKVKCAWDEDDSQRCYKLALVPTNDQEHNDLCIYLTSDNSSDCESLQGVSNARKLLALAFSDDESEGNKEFLCVPEIKQTIEQKMQDKVQKEKKELTPWDKYLLK